MSEHSDNVHGTTQTEEIQNLVWAVEEATGMVYVERPHAYAAFAEGKILFDPSENAELLNAFAKLHQSEFYGTMIVRKESGGFLRFSLHNRTLWVTHHRFAAQEAPGVSAARAEVD